MSATEAEKTIFLNLIINTLGECYKAIGINKHYESDIKPNLMIELSSGDITLEQTKGKIASFFQDSSMYDTGETCPKFLMNAIGSFPVSSIKQVESGVVSFSQDSTLDHVGKTNPGQDWKYDLSISDIGG